MFQPINNLPSKCVVDTNSLLHACFQRNSAAARALKQLVVLDKEAHLTEAIRDECHYVLDAKRIQLRLTHDPATFFNNFLQASGIVVVPPPTIVHMTGINAADQHVFAAARELGAFLLTEDLKLTAEVHPTAVQVRNPRDILLGSSAPSLDDVIGGVRLSGAASALLARVRSGNWSSETPLTQFTVIEISNIFRVYYESQSNKWKFTTPMGHVELAANVAPRQEWLIGAHFKADTSSDKTQLTLRAAGPTTNLIENRTFPGISPSAIASRTTIGHDACGANYWNGHLSRVLVDPHTISAKLWKTLNTVPNLTTDPSAGNQLDVALRIWDNQSSKGTGMAPSSK